MARQAPTPRVGILVECGRDGLEVHHCRRICALLRANHRGNFEEAIVPMDNKKRLLEECATTVRRFLAECCQRVVVLWDEEPAWPDNEEALCWSTERNHVLEDLRGANIAITNVHLVCIERACEAWLRSDDDLLSLSNDIWLSIDHNDPQALDEGVQYVIEGPLTAADGRRPNLRSIWFIDTGTDTPRLVTAYPLKGAGDD